MDQMPLNGGGTGDGEGGTEPVVVMGEEAAGLYRCSICMEEGRRESMVQACRCASCVHPECLERWIAARPGRGEERHTCEVCRAPYNLKVEKVLGTGQLCSMASWGQYCTCMLMVLMFLMMAFVTWIYVNSEEYKSEVNAGSNWVLWSLSAVTFVLFLSTIKKIYERWRDVNVSERVQIHECVDPEAPVAVAVQPSPGGTLVAAPAESLAPGTGAVLLHAAPVEELDSDENADMV